MRTSRSLSVLVALVLSAANPARALAQSPSTDAPAKDPAVAAQEAKRLFAEGAKAFEAGQIAQAEGLFEQSLALVPSYDTAANLAISETKQQKWREGAEHMALALETYPPSEDPGRREQMESLLAEMKGHVLSVRVSCDVAGTEVLSGDTSLGKTPFTRDVFLEPGSHALRFRTADGLERSVSVEGKAGETKEANVSFKGMTPDPKPGGGAEGRPAWPAILLGVGGGGAIAAGVTLVVLGLGKHADAEEQASGPCPDQACIDAGDEALSQGNAFIGGGAAALGVGAAAAIGMVIYLVVPDGSAAKSAFQLAPVITPEAFFLSMGGSF